MKKIIYIITIASTFLFIQSCDLKEEYENEMSQVVEAAGEWHCLFNHADYGTDPFGNGLTPVITYNTAADDGQEIWISDEGNFWEFTVKIPINMDDFTFGSATAVTSQYPDYPIEVIVENGKIMKNATTEELPSGSVGIDSIYFEIWFEDLEGATGIADDRLLVSGFRRTGFLEDE